MLFCGLLTGRVPFQVEVDRSSLQKIDAFMGEHGYDLIECHATMAGAKRIARGAVILDLPHNVIYEPRSEA